MNDYDIIKQLTSDGVYKFIHRNGMETTIKTTPGCGGSDKQKAVLFVSCSVGCTEGCKFCHITENNFPYKAVTTETIIEACKSAIDSVYIKDKYLKISFMGMGEVMRSNVDMFRIVYKIFQYSIIQTDSVAGIDGVDIGTSVPSYIHNNHIKEIKQIDTFLTRMRIWDGVHFNPNNNYFSRTPVRVFISLHSLNDKIRQEIMPRTARISEVDRFINSLPDVNIIFHVLLLKGVNDIIPELNILVKEFSTGKYKNHELRLLKYNKYDGSVYEKSHRYPYITNMANHEGFIIKEQISTGDDIKSACGQFICTKL